ncbi:MAG TPA: universal stress protein [Candidatus Melainabacteria bacterium]|nr:universal stress protein [Candidatus Melainabacteria bacterium]HIN63183.1 universal stress protein [Candidatus Obscuribacterales bacterium]
MSEHSILVAISGSEQSRNAAEMAWKLGAKIKAKVTAEHIVDSRTVWELLRNDKPGFVGSGPYIAAYEAVISQLNSLANKLSLEYEALASGQGIQGECLIKEGNPVAILCKDARDFDLLVIGHQPTGVRLIDQEHSHYIRYSVAEGVSHHSTVPVLIVQSKPIAWETMAIVSEIDHINYMYLKSCLKLAKLLGLKPTLEFWGTGTREEKPEHLKKNLLQMLPEAKDINFEFEYYGGRAATERKDLFQGSESSQAVEIRQDALFVLPTRGLAQDRITVFGMQPESFIRSLVLPCLLLWPEDNKAFDLTSDVEQKRLSTSNT